MELRTIPNRATVEELFPTTPSYQLDERGRRELRTVAEFVRLLNSMSETLSGATSNLYHQNVISLELAARFTGVARTPTFADASAAIQERMVSASTEDFDYFLRSSAFMRLMQAIGIKAADRKPGDTSVSYDTAANWTYGTAVLVIVNALVVSTAVLRRHPFLRFDPTDYVVFKTHYDDIDAHGVPRLSVDGYNNV